MIHLCDTRDRGIHLGALDGLGVSFWDPESALGSFGWPWGVLGGSLGGPRSIFDGFRVSLGRAWATFCWKNRSLDHDFSLHVFGMVPGSICWRFPVFGDPQNLKNQWNSYNRLQKSRVTQIWFTLDSGCLRARFLGHCRSRWDHFGDLGHTCSDFWGS